MTTVKQANQPMPNKHIRTLYRGIFPMTMRQMGLGAGIFTLPDYFFKKTQSRYPHFSEENEVVAKVFSGVAGGAVTAAATQSFEVARHLMQNDVSREKFSSSKSAFKESFRKMHTADGAKLFGLRFAVLATTAVIVNATREQCKHWQQVGGRE